jgi:hypothetical protein
MGFMHTDYYIVGTSPKIVDGVITPIETVLTKPFREPSARHTVFKWTHGLEIPGLDVRKYGSGHEYRRLLREQSKRRRAPRNLTIGEVAEIIGEVEKL